LFLSPSLLAKMTEEEGEPNGAVGVKFVEHQVLLTDTFQGICLSHTTSALELRQANGHFAGTNLACAPKVLKIPITKKARNEGFQFPTTPTLSQPQTSGEDKEQSPSNANDSNDRAPAQEEDAFETPVEVTENTNNNDAPDALTQPLLSDVDRPEDDVDAANHDDNREDAELGLLSLAAASRRMPPSMLASSNQPPPGAPAGGVWGTAACCGGNTNCWVACSCLWLGPIGMALGILTLHCFVSNKCDACQCKSRFCD